MRNLLCAVMIAVSGPALADDPDMRAIVDTHILPRYAALAREAADLADTAADECAPGSPDLIAAYHAAFDALIGVSHLRFGPSEVEDRAFALAFWPDPRGSTPKALGALVRDRDGAVFAPEAFATVSVAARGFYALEFLLFDPAFSPAEDAAYHCALVQALSADIASISASILGEWQDDYADLLAAPGNDTYRSATEAAQQVFTALSTGLEFTSETRLGRPMGTFERPRPNRAEAWRSQRSLRHVILSLRATRELAGLISSGDAGVERAFEAALARAEGLDDPVFAGVVDPQGRFEVEVLKQSIDAIRARLAEDVGPALGIAAGFNALDGD